MTVTNDFCVNIYIALIFYHPLRAHYRINGKLKKIKIEINESF